ncbi:MAG: carboxypeptidase-like regulatory domain-containing protein, partial [Terracidiphilus sp.]
MVTANNQCGLIRRILSALLLLAVACLPVFSQTVHPSSSATTRKSYTGNSSYTIAGTVVNASTGEPVRHATVAALSEEDSHIVASIESSEEGHFTLEGLSAAKYQLTASKRGFRTAFYDEHDDFSTAIVTGPGQDTEGLVFRLTPAATLRGVVSTEGGDPVEGASVMLFRRPRANEPGRRVTHMNDTSTDDTGAYEFNGLAAGEYLLAVKAEPWYALHRTGNSVSAAPIDGSADASTANAALDVAYPVTFFDGTTEETTATAIPLSGASREEANITLHAVPALHLSVETPHKQDGSNVRTELHQTVFGTEVTGDITDVIDGNQFGTTEFTG